MWVKICGICTAEAASCCVESGADAIGFVFTESRREIRVEKAADIIKTLPERIKMVGVFVDKPQSDVLAIANFLGLDLLQFHGRESPEYCSFFPGKAIKSFSLADRPDLEIVSTYRGSISACLLDTYQQGYCGGTGKTWDWPLLAGEIKQALAGLPVIAAGGLNSQNVGEAIKTLRPYGVDTSSGVEKAGQKDCELIKEYVKEVRRWENEQLA